MKNIQVIVSCLFLALIFALLTPIVDAAIDVGEEPIKNIILPGEVGGYYLDVTNTGGKDSFGITTTDNNWRLKGKTSFEIEPGQKQRIKIELLPIGELKPASYSVNIRVYSKNTAETVDKALLVNLVAFSELINAELEYSPEGLDPRKENLIKLNLKNKNNIRLENVKIKMESSLFEDERTIDLLPLEDRSEELRINFNDLVERGSYEVKLLIAMNDKVLIERAEKVNVGYYSDVTEDVKVEDGFLVKKTILFRENKGNTASEEEFNVKLNSFENTFTRMHPEAGEWEKRNGIHYYTWMFSINPGDDYRIEVKTDYLTPLIVIVVIVIVAIALYYFLKKDVSIKKKVLTIKSNGGISEMKIILVVKNTGGNLNRVQVVDRLPKIIKKPAEYGVVKPTNVKHSELGGTMILWDLQNLVRGEERVISYKIKSDIHVVGRLHMPVASVRYRTNKGKLVVVDSNRHIIS